MNSLKTLKRIERTISTARTISILHQFITQRCKILLGMKCTKNTKIFFYIGLFL